MWWLSCFERSNMSSNWTFWSVVLSSVLVHIGLASNSPHGCNAPLGLQDRKVSDSQLSSPHYYENFYIGYGRTLHTKPECARLYNGCAWCAAGRRGYYIEVDLKKNTTITGIATQGFPGLSDYYVKTYRVVYSSDGREWQQFRTSSSGNVREKIWPGNSDTQTVVENIFPSPISARFVRVFPVSYNYEICMRLELYGCRNDTLDKTTTVTSTTPTTLTTPVPTVSERQRTSTSSAMPSPHETTTSSQGSDTTDEKVITASERQKISTTSANIPSPHLPTPSPKGSQIKDPSPHKNPPTVPTEKIDSLEEDNARIGEYHSARNTLVIGLIVGVAFLFICSVPVVMLLLFKCHERQKSYISKYQVNNDGFSGIPLTSVVYDAGLCKQELDECKYPAFEEYSSNGIGHHGPCQV